MPRATHLTATLVVALAASCGGSSSSPLPTGTAGEHCYPNMFEALPRGLLPAGTTVVVLTMKTDRPAVCRQDGLEGVYYVDMVNTFESTGGLEHTTRLFDLPPGPYRWFARCQPVADPSPDCATPHDLIFLFEIPGY